MNRRRVRQARPESQRSRCSCEKENFSTGLSEAKTVPPRSPRGLVLTWKVVITVAVISVEINDASGYVNWLLVKGTATGVIA